MDQGGGDGSKNTTPRFLKIEESRIYLCVFGRGFRRKEREESSRKYFKLPKIGRAHV